jgi:hypothetical protein
MMKYQITSDFLNNKDIFHDADNVILPCNSINIWIWKRGCLKLISKYSVTNFLTVWFVLLNKGTVCYISVYDFSAMIPWLKENGHTVFQKHGCVMTMMTALMEKMNISVHASGKGHTVTGSDICMTATGATFLWQVILLIVINSRNGFR